MNNLDRNAESHANELRWQRACTALAIQPDLEEYSRLTTAYSEPQRAYHTLQHLSECFERLDWSDAQNQSKDTAFVEIALWYHDCVYQPRSSDNELMSADWASRFLCKSGLDDTSCELVRSLIMSTCYGKTPEDLLHQFVVDIDLSILGADVERFEEYEKQVRIEYKWVPLILYQKKRKEILRDFLNLSRIYNTDKFYENLENQARQNLENSIAKLS